MQNKCEIYIIRMMQLVLQQALSFSENTTCVFSSPVPAAFKRDINKAV